MTQLKATATTANNRGPIVLKAEIYMPPNSTPPSLDTTLSGFQSNNTTYNLVYTYNGSIVPNGTKNYLLDVPSPLNMPGDINIQATLSGISWNVYVVNQNDTSSIVLNGEMTYNNVIQQVGGFGRVSSTGKLSFDEIFVTNVAPFVNASDFTANPNQPAGNGEHSVDVHFFYNNLPYIPTGDSVLILEPSNTNLKDGAIVPTGVYDGTIYIYNNSEANLLDLGQIGYRNPTSLDSPDESNTIDMQSFYRQPTVSPLVYNIVTHITLPKSYPPPELLPVSLEVSTNSYGLPELQIVYSGYPSGFPSSAPPQNPPSDEYTTYRLTEFSVSFNSAPLNIVVALQTNNANGPKKIKAIAHPVHD